jgi:uncharacterized protein Veg
MFGLRNTSFPVFDLSTQISKTTGRLNPIDRANDRATQVHAHAILSGCRPSIFVIKLVQSCLSLSASSFYLTSILKIHAILGFFHTSFKFSDNSTYNPCMCTTFGTYFQKFD